MKIRYILYALIIAVAYQLFQFSGVQKILVNFISEILMGSFIALVGSLTYLYMQHRHRKILTNPISRTPVEFDADDRFSVMEMGWLYGVSTKKNLAAGILELWKHKYISLELDKDNRPRVKILRLPTREPQLSLLSFLVFSDDPVPGMYSPDVRELTTGQHYWSRFYYQKKQFLKLTDLTKTAYNTKFRKLNFYGLIILSLLFLFISKFFGPFVFIVSSVLVILTIVQFYKIYFKKPLTKKGLQVYDRLVSYREYLAKTHKNRITVSDVSHAGPGTFPDLPYATLFGFETIWVPVLSSFLRSDYHKNNKQ